jgi:predicted nucleotidyltransferase
MRRRRDRPVRRRASARASLASLGIRVAAEETPRDEIRASAAHNRAVSVSVFGSVAHGDGRPDSDIDFLVEFEPGASLLDLMWIQDDVEALLGGPIEVVPAAGPKDRDDHIRREPSSYVPRRCSADRRHP